MKKLKHFNFNVRMHKSIDDIIDIIQHLKGEYIFMPVAYTSEKKDYNWTNFNFIYHKKIKICNIFFDYTMEMVLVENKNYKKNKCVIHPATKIFSDKFFENKKINIEYEYTSSKFIAYNKFKVEMYRYTIISSNVLENNNNEIVLEKYNPEMIWVLYKVKEDD
ncbi:hypothetical protein [Streptobacillus felis]|nr:hypothetical protein [Streptobacillus felis]